MDIAFAVNSKQFRFFKKLQNKIKELKVVKTKKLFFISLKGIKYINRVNLNNAVNYAIKEVEQKYEYKFKFIKYIIKIYFKFLSYINYFRFFKDVSKYDRIYLWNGLKFEQMIIREIAKLYNKQIFYFENGFLPNRIVIDEKGVNFYNSVPREKSFYCNYKFIKELPSKLVPRVPINKSFKNHDNISLPSEFIFAPFQVDYDSQIILLSPWIKNMREFFFILKSIAEELNINIVFKEHPSSKKNYKDLKKIAMQSKLIYFANNYSTQELIEKAQGIITINSSVGIESLLFNKKVITLGKAFYNIEGIVKHASSKEEVITILKNFNKWVLDEKLIKKFLSYLYYDYLIDSEFNDIDKIKKRLKL